MAAISTSSSTCARGCGAPDIKKHKMSIDKDRVKGSAKNLGGKSKEAVGTVTGEAKTEAEGKADQVEGKIQNTWGSAKDSLKGR
jgi:uncharacterized protein YjbJ (UPF0337 family)